MSSISKNIFHSLLSFFSRIISGAIVFIVLARLISVNDFGLLSFGTTLAGLIMVMAEFGYSLMAQKDIPQKRFELNSYVFNTFIQKSILSLVATIIGVLYLCYGYDGLNLKIGIIFIINAVITSNNMYLFSIFRSKNMFKIERNITFIYTFILIFILAFFIIFSKSIVFIAYGMCLSRLVQLISLILSYIKNFEPKQLRIEKSIQEYLLKNVSSYGIHYIIGIFYFTIDSQLIAYYSGNEELAIYQSYFKIVMIVLMVSDLFINVFLPYLSSLYSINDEKQFVSNSFIINKFLVIIGLVLFIFLNLFSSIILEIIYLNKYDSALPLVIPLGIVLMFRALASIYAIILTISGRQIDRVYVVLISLLINISLNLLIVPTYGFIGAAYVSMITHFVMYFLYLYFTKKIIRSYLLSVKTAAYILGSLFFILLVQMLFFEREIIFSILLMVLWLISLSQVISKKEINTIIKIFNN